MDYPVSFDVIVVGCGNAGAEASLASARMGCKTLLVTHNVETIGQLSCNPSIGGTAKSQLVFEIDALGGKMGYIADKATIQKRMLNSSKGPAVHSLRAQMDKNKYHEIAKKELEGDPGMMLYDSGARGSFGNNYKNMCVMKGPVMNSNTGKYEVVQTSFMEGIEKKDIPTMGTSVVSGAYPKAVGTGVAGYFTKQILAAMQAVTADPNLDDCGTHGFIEVEVTSNKVEDLLFRHIIDGGKTVLLDDEIIKKYIGKKVKMYSPMLCTSGKICRKCLGLMFEKLGIVNVGLTSARVSSTILNLSMKKFHNTTTQIYEVKNTKDLFF